MSNDGVGKIKQKRKHVPSKPYTRAQSFLGKVKDTVKEILQPSWLGSIFKPAAKSESAPSTPMPPQVKPDSQFSSSTPRRNAYPLNSLHRASRGGPPPNMYSTVDGHMPFGTYGSNTQPSSSEHGAGLGFEGGANVGDLSLASALPPATQTPSLREEEESVILDDSRLHDQPQRKTNPKQDEATAKRGRSTPEPDTSVMSPAQDMSSFFGKPSKRARTTGPQFNISLFTTPRPSSAEGNSSMMFKSSFQQSPYYPGKTTYGGAASHRKSRLKATATYQSNLSVQKVTPKPLNKSSTGTVTSSTARKILDALESMPSVLHDAKRIPVNNSSLYDSPLSFSPSSFPRRRSWQQNTSRLGTPSGAPPTSRVNVLGLASIAKNRQYLLPVREQQPAEDTRPAEKGTPVSAARPTATHIDTPHPSSGKMKRDKTRHYQALKDDDDDVVELPDLPTKFVLPSDGFKLDIAVKAPQPKSKSPAVPASPPQFTFSSPIQKMSSPRTASPGAPSGFQFSSPIALDENKQEEKGAVNSIPEVQFNTGVPTGIKLKPKPKAKEAPVMAGIAPAAELKQGSVMDILGKSSAFASNKSPASNVPKSSASGDTKKQVSVATVNSFLDKLTPAAGSWSCPTCMINNQPNVTKCVACMTSKPTEKKETSPSPTFKRLQQPAPGSWDCPICMINNKPERSSCAACQAKKPQPSSEKSASIMTGCVGGWNCSVCLLVNSADKSQCIACTAPKPAKKPPAPKAIVPDKDIIAKLKPPEGSWECPTCMVSNKAHTDKCICCGTGNPKPKSSVSKGSNVSVKTDPTLYDKLKPPEGNWECPVCMISNKPSSHSCVACMTPNPNKSVKSISENALEKLKKPAENWTCDTCLVSNNATALKCIACETPKPGATKASGFAKPGGFNFGGNSNSGFVFGAVSSSSALFSFGGTITSDANSKEKTTEPSSAGFRFGATSESSGAAGFAVSSSTTNSNGAFKFGGNASEKKDSAPSSLFTFGAKAPDTKTETKSDLTPGGFKFEESNKNLGINFGQASSESKETKTMGGFAFNAGTDSNKTSSLAGALSASTKSASLGGGSKTTDTSSAAGGFTFGGSAKRKAVDDESKTKTAPEIKFGAPATSLSQPQRATEDVKKNGSIGGFAFKPESSAAGLESKGFTFQAGTTQTTVSAVFGAESEPATKRKPEGIPGGFSFSQSNSSSNTPTFGQSTNPTPATSSATFNFGAAANPVPASSSTTATFNFGQPVSVASSSSTGFGFGQTASSAPTTSNVTSSTFTFGAQPASASSTPASSGFNFGQAAAAPAASTFQFGQSGPATTSASAPTGGFAFGQSASSSQPATTTSTFTFGATATSKAPAFGGFNAAPAQPAAAPSFGAATAPAFGQQPASQPAPFGSQNTATPFGGQSTAASFSQATPAFGATAPAAAPAFGSGTPAVPAFGATPTTTPGPAFGAGSTGFGTQASAPPAFGGQTSTPAAGFNFAASPPPSTFNFGAQQAPTSAPFQFGAAKSQPNPAASQPAANQGFSFNATPNLNFGATAAPANPQQAFQFNAAPATGQDGNPFSVAPPSNIAGRKIKRATRKLKSR